MANNSLISDKMVAALNQQIVNELSASMQYIAIAAYFDGLVLITRRLPS